ncbi:MAG: saccharopine dehydrogenase family protein [Anaerolineae bacterium]|nr:saccharopine dehydrogenase family protein [Anaerolineae bacterium]
MKITILGAGRVGSAIARDLAADPTFQVTVVDRDAGALDRACSQAPLQPHVCDLASGYALRQALAEADLAVSAVPGHMGFATLEHVIRAGVDVVDISFFAEDPFLLDALARERGVTAVVDCGVAPGLCNILAGHVAASLDTLSSYLCYVGGLPQVRQWPFEYAAVFSPLDVIEEYTRPARLVENGQLAVRPALSDLELIDMPEIGTLEAFNTDGLRTLLRTLDCPSMREKTLRYPGHAERMRVFRESGFFDREPVQIGEQAVRPIDLTAHLLARAWTLVDPRDLTVLRVVIGGTQGGQQRTYTYDLLDRYDAASGASAMARTTGYTCAIVARQLARGLFRPGGVCAPETLGRRADCYEDLLAGLAARGVTLRETID